MAERVDIDRLEVILASVGRHLVVDGVVDRVAEAVVDDDAVERRDRGPWGRRLLAAAAVFAVASAAVASVPPARRVVSGWLRAGNIEVDIDPDVTIPPELPAFVADIAPLDEDRLAERLGHAVPVLSGSLLGSPEAWWSPPERGILATWDDEATSLWIVVTAETYPGPLEKWLREPEAATAVADLGDGGFVVDGGHIFQTPFRTVAANSVVAWSDGDLTYRLDSTMPSDELLDVARSIAGG